MGLKLSQMLALGALAAAAGTLGACGSDGPEDVVSEYIAATRDGDATAACAAIARSVPESDFSQDCDPPDDAALAAIEVAAGEFEFETVEDGDSAIVTVRPPDGSEGGDLLLIQEDDEWKIVGDSVSIDADAKAGARTAQTVIETLATDQNGSYDGATVEQLAEIDPSMTEVELSIDEASDDTYTLSVPSITGVIYSITRSPDGVVSFDCEPAGTGGCPDGGDWAVE